ncbi:MAG: phosphatidate cytidylyltransferase [Thermoleophilia bacterium]|nr:phosphatidate cytidylyltransferase [Thermoleophilia bacterium]
MKNRVAVAAVLLPIVYLALWVPWQHQLLFAILVTVVVLIATLELMVMLRPLKPFVPAAAIAVGLVPIACWRAGEPGAFIALVLVIPLTIIFLSLSVEREEPLGAILATMMPVAYIAPPAALLVALRQSPEGFGLVIVMLLGIWANDTGAYLLGRLFGRTKLAPRISPNKTVEGFLGGFIAGTAVVWYGHLVLQAHGKPLLNGYDALLLGMAVALATPVGDLFESMIKRAAGVKDSGNLLGEHGGMLDRIDSILLATPVMYLGCYFTGVL